MFLCDFNFIQGWIADNGLFDLPASCPVNETSLKKDYTMLLQCANDVRGDNNNTHCITLIVGTPDKENHIRSL